MEKTLRRTWAEINLDHLAYNYQALRRQAGPQAKFLGVVKADAYGHGAVHVARKLEQLGADYLAVSNVEEAEELRQGEIHLPILVLGYTPSEMTSVLIAHNVAQDVPSLEMARAYSKEASAAGSTLRVHLKLDTGMGRLGFQCDEAHFERSLDEILQAVRLPGLEWEGIFMHFCVADEPECADHRAFTKLQFERFRHMVEEVERRACMRFAIHHCANSGATAYYPEFAWDMVRPGILLYGTGQVSRDLGLKPVMALKTAVGQVKEFEPDTSVSYGRTYFTGRGPSRIGVLPIGYADGFSRCLSNRWQVLTREGEAPIRGRICMDMCMADLTDLPGVGPGDEVEVFGEHNSVDRMAELAGTITYELLCAVSRRVPRIYLEGGRAVERNLMLQL
ncbi:alanine racemase [Oscillibacter hominis]|uniref:Alanine racemase n=1 Tax=Oscillibacter hominis TaxID=2763056 RepID=A0A7G9B871_9FIRM|nr:alanine racemase [Oscillibacter hominis]QNL45752.1 alanine racemase [Oscillibacter hominis]